MPLAEPPRVAARKGFEKGRVLFNMHRVLKQGVPVVSCFGASLCEAHADLLVEAGVKTCILMFDGDDGGRAGMEQALPILAKRLFVRTIGLDEGTKPDIMDEALLRSTTVFRNVALKC